MIRLLSTVHPTDYGDTISIKELLQRYSELLEKHRKKELKDRYRAVSIKDVLILGYAGYSPMPPPKKVTASKWNNWSVTLNIDDPYKLDVIYRCNNCGTAEEITKKGGVEDLLDDIVCKECDETILKITG